MYTAFYNCLSLPLPSFEVEYRPWVQFLGFPRTFLLLLPEFIDGTSYNTGLRLDSVNQTHLALASGKLVLQKHFSIFSIYLGIFQISATGGSEIEAGSETFNWLHRGGRHYPQIILKGKVKHKKEALRRIEFERVKRKEE